MLTMQTKISLRLNGAVYKALLKESAGAVEPPVDSVLGAVFEAARPVRRKTVADLLKEQEEQGG